MLKSLLDTLVQTSGNDLSDIVIVRPHTHIEIRLLQDLFCIGKIFEAVNIFW